MLGSNIAFCYILDECSLLRQSEAVFRISVSPIRVFHRFLAFHADIVPIPQMLYRAMDMLFKRFLFPL